MKANIQIDLKIEFIKNNNTYTAYADIFNAYGVGSTKTQAQKSLKQSLDIYINEYLKLGVLFDKLKDEGFKKSIVVPRSTNKNKTYKKLNYDIPLNNYGKEKRQYA